MARLNFDLSYILAYHQKWLNDEDDGVRANLSRADLCGADLRGADLRGADLRGADLSRADLGWADLRGADLREADLHRTGLSDADLRDADLRGAGLHRTALCGAKGVIAIQFDIRGYQLVMWTLDDIPMFTAGCHRGITLDEALDHWGSDKYPDKQRGAMYCYWVKALAGSLEAVQS